MEKADNIKVFKNGGRTIYGITISSGCASRLAPSKLSADLKLCVANTALGGKIKIEFRDFALHTKELFVLHK